MLPFELTKDTPYLALSGELWSVFYEYFNEIDRVIKGFYCMISYLAELRTYGIAQNLPLLSPFLRNKLSINPCKHNWLFWCYRKTSSISRTKSQSLNVSCILLQLSSLNLLRPGIKLRMKM